MSPLIERIRAAAASRDAETLVAPAHTLKGLLSNFCADASVGAAGEIEQQAREQRLDGIDALVQGLEQETTRLRSELQAFLETQRQ